MASLPTDPSTDQTADPSTSPTAPSNPWTPDEESAARAWATNYITQHQIPAGFGGADDLVNSYFTQRQNGVGHDQAMATVPGLLGWDKYQPTAPPPPPGPGGPSAPPPSILPPGSIGSLLAPFTQAAPNYVNPTYPTAPSFPDIPTWQSPSAADAANLPGYKFARDQGIEGLVNSAAARGVTNTGGTLEDIIKFGDQFAGQNYQTARANSFDDYQTNVANKYLLPYQAAYQTFGVQNPQAGIDASNKNAFNWNNYLQGYNIFRNNSNDAFNKLFSTATLGSSVQ